MELEIMIVDYYLELRECVSLEFYTCLDNLGPRVKEVKTLLDVIPEYTHRVTDALNRSIKKRKASYENARNGWHHTYGRSSLILLERDHSQRELELSFGRSTTVANLNGVWHYEHLRTECQAATTYTEHVVRAGNEWRFAVFLRDRVLSIHDAAERRMVGNKHSSWLKSTEKRRKLLLEYPLPDLGFAADLQLCREVQHLMGSEAAEKFYQDALYFRSFTHDGALASQLVELCISD